MSSFMFMVIFSFKGLQIEFICEIIHELILIQMYSSAMRLFTNTLFKKLQGDIKIMRAVICLAPRRGDEEVAPDCFYVHTLCISNGVIATGESLH